MYLCGAKKIEIIALTMAGQALNDQKRERLNFFFGIFTPAGDSQR